MAKAYSPLRIQADLMKAAERTAQREHRSTAEQIEYWADIGRQVSAHINSDTLLSIATGAARILVEPAESQPVPPQEVFDELEQERRSGVLSQTVSKAAVRYQVCEAHPGYLEQVDREGNRTAGAFRNGEFISLGSGDSQAS